MPYDYMQKRRNASPETLPSVSLPPASRTIDLATYGDVEEFYAEQAAPAPTIDDFLGGTDSVKEVYGVAV